VWLEGGTLVCRFRWWSLPLPLLLFVGADGGLRQCMVWVSLEVLVRQSRVVKRTTETYKSEGSRSRPERTGGGCMGQQPTACAHSDRVACAWVQPLPDGKGKTRRVVVWMPTSACAMASLSSGCLECRSWTANFEPRSESHGTVLAIGTTLLQGSDTEGQQTLPFSSTRYWNRSEEICTRTMGGP
jgi:hypothetical protein